MLGCSSQAYHRGLFGSDYILLTHRGYETAWWTLSTNSSCPPKLMATALVQSFAFVPDGYLLRIDETNLTISGLVSLLKRDLCNFLSCTQFGTVCEN